MRTLLVLPIVLLPGGEVAGQRFVLVQIEATQRAFRLAIAKPGFGTSENAIGIRVRQLVCVPAHPPCLPGRVAGHQRVIGHGPGHHTAGGNEAVPSKFNTTDNRRVCAHGGSAAQQRLLVDLLSVDLRARIAHVGQHAARTQEHIVLDSTSGVDRHVVLDLDVVSDRHIITHVYILPECAAAADARAGLDVAKVPDARAFAYVDGRIHPGRFVDGDAGQ